MNIIKLSLLLALALLTQSCASTDLKRNPKISLPLQIMEAADRGNGLQDIEKIKLEELIKRNKQMDFLYLAEAGVYAIDYVKPLPGMSRSGSIGLSLLMFFLSGGAKIGEVSQLLVWMPKEMAENSQEAQIKMGRILEKAAINALSDEYNAKAVEWTDQATLGALSPVRVIKINGPLCPEWSCVMQGTIPTKTHLLWKGKMREMAIPEYISGGPGQGFGYRTSGGWPGVSVRKITEEYDENGSRGAHWHRLKTERLSDFDHKGWYVRLSENLPAWAYYLHMPDRNNLEHAVFPIPLMLTQGKPLLFVKPK